MDPGAHSVAAWLFGGLLFAGLLAAGFLYAHRPRDDAFRDLQDEVDRANQSPGATPSPAPRPAGTEPDWGERSLNAGRPGPEEPADPGAGGLLTRSPSPRRHAADNCPNCGSGQVVAPLFRTSVDRYNAELESLDAAADSGESLWAWAQAHHDPSVDPRGSVLGFVRACPTCGQGLLEIHPVRQGFLGEEERSDIPPETLELSPAVTAPLLRRLQS